jgi:L-threonylcarbamoyladenylate synthase
MKTEFLNSGDPDALIYAFQTLLAGELVAFPTDTVYGVGALVFDRKAVERIYVAKGRLAEKSIPVLLASIEQLEKVTVQVPELAAKLADRFWPGPLTLIVPKHPAVPDAVSPTETIGVRVPNHPTTRALLRLSGPLAVTSANLSGQESSSTAAEVRAKLGGRIALILDGGRTPGGVPSTIVDCMGPELKILRQGPVTLEQIKRILALTS